MRTFVCACENTIFFENSLCLACKREVGWCPACRRMTVLLPGEGGELKCGNSACGSRLVKCLNYAVESVCNRCVVPVDPIPEVAPFCEYCRFNNTIPDLSVAGNREKWLRLETAKRRLLYTLDLLGLPYGTKEDGVSPPLSFDFKEDVAPKNRWWWSMGVEERVYTGHANGNITINVREADSVEREKARVLFQEEHRTVIGHFRHEIGHYYWQMLVAERCEAECARVFGDHLSPTYADAQKRFYKEGAPPHWKSSYVSAYASMHPWEDFAETFATYLDMVSVLDTAKNLNVGGDVDPLAVDLPAMVDAYIQQGIAQNEMNRAMGLHDLVPEVFVPPVVAKMQFVHDLIRAAAGKPAPTGHADKKSSPI